MNWTVTQRILGLLLMMFSVTLLPPIAISVWYDDKSWLPFIESVGLILGIGLACWCPARNNHKDLRLRGSHLR